jgi:hypothetical protein
MVDHDGKIRPCQCVLVPDQKDGVAIVRVVALLDDETCEYCAERDGLEIPIADLGKPGVEVPPFHDENGVTEDERHWDAVDRMDQADSDREE